MLESAPADGERGLPCHSQRVQHIAAGICQDVQLSEKSSQVTSKSGPDRACVTLLGSVLVTSVNDKSQCLFMAINPLSTVTRFSVLGN